MRIALRAFCQLCVLRLNPSMPFHLTIRPDKLHSSFSMQVIENLRDNESTAPVCSFPSAAWSWTLRVRGGSAGAALPCPRPRAACTPVAAGAKADRGERCNSPPTRRQLVGTRATLPCQSTQACLLDKHPQVRHPASFLPRLCHLVFVIMLRNQAAQSTDGISAVLSAVFAMLVLLKHALTSWTAPLAYETVIFGLVI